MSTSWHFEHDGSIHHPRVRAEESVDPLRREQALREALDQSEAMLTIALKHGADKRARIQELERLLSSTRAVVHEAKQQPLGRDEEWRLDIDRFNAQTAEEFSSLRRGFVADANAVAAYESSIVRAESSEGLRERLRAALDGQARAEQALGDALTLLDPAATRMTVHDLSSSSDVSSSSSSALVAVGNAEAAAAAATQIATHEQACGRLRAELGEERERSARAAAALGETLSGTERQLETVSAAALQAQTELELVRNDCVSLRAEAASSAALARSRSEDVEVLRAEQQERQLVAQQEKRAKAAAEVAAEVRLTDDAASTGSCALCDVTFDAWRRGRECSECGRHVCARHFELCFTAEKSEQAVLCRDCAVET